MAVESKRGCGFRKAGGLYVVGKFHRPEAMEAFCTDYEQTRTLRWADPARLFATAQGIPDSYTQAERIALMWVGESHYSKASFTREALAMGVSKRVSSLPIGMKAGDPIALAHPSGVSTFLDDLGVHVGTHCKACWNVPAAKAIGNHGVATMRYMTKAYRAALAEWGGELTPGLIERVYLIRECVAAHDGGSGTAHEAQVDAYLRSLLGYGKPEQVAGVFGLFFMERVEVVLPEGEAYDPAIQATCEERGVTIVPVPNDDPDHVTPGWKLPAFLREKSQPDLGLVAEADDDTEREATEATL
jgi:hypothetical protein